LDRVLLAEIDYDPQRWTDIPNDWGNGTLYDGPEDFAKTTAEEVWGLWVEQNPGVEKPEQSAVDRTAVEILSYADKWGGFDPLSPFQVATYLHRPSPTVSVLPVKVWVDDTPELTVEHAAGVDNPDAIRPPTVEQFHTEILGAGLKVTCHGTLDPQPGDLPGAQTVWVQVRYTFAVPTRQAVVTVAATDTDLGRMSGALDDIDEFVRQIHLLQNVPDGLPVPWSPPAT
jgi:hypothetical protein